MRLHQVIFLLLIATLLFSSCVVKKYQSPGLPVSGQLYRDTSLHNHLTSDTLARDTSSIADVPYTKLFADTVLQNLIAEGLRENLDVKTAVQRINEAEANLRQSQAAFFPNVAANVRAARNRQSVSSLNLPPNQVGTFPLSTSAYQLSLSSSWEADIWGKLASAKRSAFANLLRSEASKRAVETEVVASIANYYYQLLSLDKQLSITLQTLENRKQDVAIVRQLKEGAIVNGAAVVQSEANQYAAAVAIPDIKRSIRETENALSILLARTPTAIKRDSLAPEFADSSLQTGISSVLLKNRPDVQAAEFAFRAAFENTNLSRTYFYPQLTLTAEGGSSSLNITNLFNMSVFYNIIAGITQPIFNNGINKARLKITIAQQQEAYYAFQQSVLNAGVEVSNALYSYQSAREKQQSRNGQLQALEKAVEYTRALISYSSATNYTDVLTSEQALLTAQLSAVNDRLQQQLAVVELYRALGGGWK